MAEKMAIYGLRHKRARLAGEIAALQEANRVHTLRAERSMARIAENEARVESLLREIDALERFSN